MTGPTGNTNGRAVLAHALAHRPAGATAWTVPRWSSPTFAGIFPFGVTVGDHFVPVGTAFTVSTLGFVASAFHVVDEAIAHHPRGDRLRRELADLPPSLQLDHIGLAVFHSHEPAPGQFTVSIWFLEGCDGAPPTDLIFGFPRCEPQVPRLALPISFAIPRVGATVYCLGYGGMTYPDGGIPLRDIAAGDMGWLHATALDLRVVEARVLGVLTRGVAGSYRTGPCLLVEGEAEHGQSGGPVLTEDGYVCGVVSAGTSVFTPGRRTSAVSLLYPAVFTSLRFGVQVGPVRMNAGYPLLERIAHGDVATDGSEDGLFLTPDDDDLPPIVGPQVHRDDGAHVFEDIQAWLDGRPVAPVQGMVHRLRRVEPGDPGESPS